MLSYMLPTEEKPPVADMQQLHHHHAPMHQHQQQKQQNYRSLRFASSDSVSASPSGHQPQPEQPVTYRVTRTTSLNMFTSNGHHQGLRPGSAAPLLPPPPPPPRRTSSIEGGSCTSGSSPKHHNGSVLKPTLLHTKTPSAKDESIDSDKSSTGGGGGGSGKASANPGPKHANLKRVSFGSSKGSMVETLVYETPVQEEPEINHFVEHNGRLSTASMISVPDTDEGREKVRVSLLGPKPFPSTPGVLLLEPTIDVIMAAGTAELLTAHTDHTIPTYHTQISTDSGWDNPFRPDGDLSREADEIVELIKGGKPITPTPGQNAPALPGCERKNVDQLDASASPLLDGKHRNGNAHSTPIKPSGQQQSANDKTATVEVGRVTAAGPGDASQVEHVTLKKKPKCKCCVLQ